MKTITAFCLILAVCAGSLVSAQTLSTTWNYPMYSYLDSNTIVVYLILKPSNASGTDATVLSRVGNLAGLSGELHFDPEAYSSPRIKPGNLVTTVKTVGMLLEPGVYKFSLYTDPTSILSRNSSIDSAVAQFIFTFNQEGKTRGGTFFWKNCHAARLLSASRSERVRTLYDGTEFTDANLESIVVRNSVSDWYLYE